MHVRSTRMQSIAVLIAAITIISLPPSAPAETVTLQNESLKLIVNAADGSFTIESPTTNKPFITAGTLAGVKGSANKSNSKDVFGDRGEVADVIDANGSRASIAVFPKLPFALIRLTLANRGAEPL